MSVSIDSVDRQIVSLLQQDGRLSNKAISTAIGIAESTVAIRLKRLMDARIVRIGVVQDVQALGRPLHAIVTIGALPGRLDAVAMAIAAQEEVGTVVTTLGPAEVIAFLFARDLGHVEEIVRTRIAPQEGVNSVEVDIAQQVYRFSTSAGMLVDG